MRKIIYCIIAICCSAWQLSYAQTVQLWGMTTYGGKDTLGNIYSIDGDGSNFHNVLSFNGVSGYDPENDLLEVSNGKLYGVTGDGGTESGGNIFSIDPITDSFNNIYNFPFISSKGSVPASNLMQADNGLIYGMTFAGGNNGPGNNGGYGVIFSFNPANDEYKRLYAFDSTLITGCLPEFQNLMQSSNGKLYGYAQEGEYYESSGTADNGVIFSFNISDSSYTDLYNFDDQGGNYPTGSLTEGLDGKLYGSAGGGVYGGGVIFSFDTSTNTYKDIFNFYDTLGRFPGTLVQSGSGKFYGTCGYGGYGDGVIFSYDPSDSSYERLYEFTGYSGENPSNILLASDGNLYGVTANGGFYGQGDIFRFNPDSNTFKDIFDFDTTDGEYALSALIEYKTPAGINQLSVNNNQLSIYPNPSSGTFTIKSTKNIDAFKVTNLLGQIILKSPLGDLGVTQFTFNINATGMYFVTVTSDNETETKKVVVAK